jgi:hypothetical protein
MKKDMIFEIEPKLLLIGTITISEEIVSLLSIGVSKIKINEEFEPQQGTLDQRLVDVVPSTTKTTKFNVRP